MGLNLNIQAMLWILGLVFVMGIITLIGHNIWVFFATIFSSTPQASPPPTPPRLTDLQATQRELRRLWETGTVDDATYAKLAAAITAEIGRLSGTRSVPPPLPPFSPSLKTDVPPAQILADRHRAKPAFVPVVPAPQPAHRQPVVPPLETPSAQWPGPIAKVPPLREPPSIEEPPRPPLSEMLGSFMEEKNIRWGELIGGLLIVCCSTALVVSLWSQISRVPLLKFAIFTGMTTSFFGAGLYTEHRWKLPTTSRGLLIIASLLVPLNFLAISAFSQEKALGDPGMLVLESLSLALFFYLTFLAGKILVPQFSSLLAAGVLIPSASMLFAPPLLSPDVSIVLPLLAAVPVFAYCLCQAFALNQARHWLKIERRESSAVFILLGVLTFACLLAFTLLLYKAGSVHAEARRFSPLISLAALPSLAAGLFLSRRTSTELSGTRTAGLATALAGIMIQTAAACLAWPNPSTLLATSALNFMTLTVVAILIEWPALHLGAGIFLIVAFLFPFLAIQTGWNPNSPEIMIHALLSAKSGILLAPLFVLLAAASEVLTKRKRPNEAFYYGLLSIGVATISLLLITAYAFLRPKGFYVPLVYALFAGGAFRYSLRTKNSALFWAGSVLLLAATAQMAITVHAAQPWLIAFLIFAGLTSAGALLSRSASTDIQQWLSSPLRISSLAASLIAATILLFALPELRSTNAAMYSLCLSVIWFIQACQFAPPALFAGFQLSLIATIVFSMNAVLRKFAWYWNSLFPPLEPWVFQSMGIALTLLCLGFILVRLMIRKMNPNSFLLPLLSPHWPAVDSILAGLLPLGLLWLGLQGVLPGLTQELSRWPGYGQSIPQAHALDWHSWLFGGILLTMLLARQWQRFSKVSVLNLLIVAAASCALLAGVWEHSNAASSALRWYCASFLAIGSVFLWARAHVWRMCLPLGWPEMETRAPGLSRYARWLLLLLTVFPIFLLTFVPTFAAIMKHPLRGPNPGSFFNLLGDTVSFGLPLLIVAGALIGHAVRERSNGYAFAAGLVLNLTITLGFFLHLSSSHSEFELRDLYRLIQWNILTSSFYALGWLYSISRKAPGAAPGALLKLQVFLGAFGNMVLLASALWFVFLSPVHPPVPFAELSTAAGWLALAVALAGHFWLKRLDKKALSGRYLCAVFLSCGLLFAFGFSGSNQPWFAYRRVLMSFVAASWLTFLAAVALLSNNRGASRFPSLTRFIDPKAMPDSAGEWSAAAAVAAILFALRALESSGNLWWIVASLGALSILSLGFAFWRQEGIYLLPAVLLMHLTVSIYWCTLWWRTGEGAFLELLEVNALALSLAGLGWLRADRRDPRLWASFCSRTSILCVVILTYTVSYRLFMDASGHALYTNASLSFLTLFTTAVFVVWSLWDSAARHSVAALSVLGLIGAGMILDQFDFTAHLLLWSCTLIAAFYSFALCYLWKLRTRIGEISHRMHIPEHPQVSAWFHRSVLLLAGFVIFSSLFEVWTYSEFTQRILAAMSVFLQAAGLSFLVQRNERSPFAMLSLTLGCLGVATLGWALYAPEAMLLNRLSVTVLLLAITIRLCAFLFIRRTPEGEWSRAARSLIPWLGGSYVLALVIVLSTEIASYRQFGSTGAEPVAIAIIGLAILDMLVTSIAFAVVEGRDPFGFAEDRRRIYVYAAEVLLALFFLHVRLTLPWLFAGLIEKYWPLAIMVLAFAGVGLSEFFQRKRKTILSEPLQRTGIFLPLLPVLGFWSAPSHVPYSGLLFTVGFLYGFLSITRRSFPFGLLASLAVNGGFWYWLHQQTGYGFVDHPQLWLIPAALSVLAAAHLNRRQLSEEQMARIRYLSLMTIYVSSTADMFINGVSRSPWLPLILAGLSVAGVLAGMALRIRSFLYLGTTFLLLALLSMIRLASVNFGWTWLWYVAGILLGLMIITLFALFEKKREDMLRLLDQLREWEK